MRGPIHFLIDRLSSRIAVEVWKDRAMLSESPREQYGAIAALAGRYGYDSLSASELRVFSQNGEDGVLAEIFRRIGTSNRFFVEFGVEDGVECNTRFLAEVLGWSGVYFEPDDAAHARLSSRLANRPDVVAIKHTVTPENVDELFVGAGVPEAPDLLSIDIDGQDYWVWKGLSAFDPRVVVIEYNSTLESSARLVEPQGFERSRERTGFFGASLGALVALGNQKGYRLVHLELTGVNAFFVRENLASYFGPPLFRGANYDLAGRRHPSGEGSYVEVLGSPGGSS